MLELGGLVIGGIIDWFKNKQEIKKLSLEQQKEIIVAETNAKIEKIKKEVEQDFDLNKESIKAMEKTWKDEFVLVLISLPLVMLFVPSLQGFAIIGFSNLNNTPIWYQILIVSVFFSIYGLRDILKIVLQLMFNKIKGNK